MNGSITSVHGLGVRCTRWKMHHELLFSESATCFHCEHFHQPADAEGETRWSLAFDDEGTCRIGMTNANE